MTGELDYNSYSHIKRLSDEELEVLWREYLADKTRRDLRDKIIVQYIYLTRYVIGRIKVNLPPSFTLEDIASYGVEGLIDAIEKFSAEKGTRFETYALLRIRGNIIDKVRSQDFLPRSVRKRIKQIKDTFEEMKLTLGRTPTTKELASKLGIEEEKINEILADDTNVYSLYDKKSGTDDTVELIDTIQDERKLTPEEQLEEKDVKKQLHDALKKLPERERMIMVLYYHENMTLKEIGDTIEISESRVCQLHAQAIMKLKKLLSTERSNRLQKSIVKC